MAASSKFDMSSGNPDKPLYSAGQRGSLVASMERSSSFRESTENPILASLPSISRNGSTVTQGEVINFLQNLPFDPKLMATEHKFHRQGDLRRLISVALGIQPDESPSGSVKSKLMLPEELKRVKTNLREGSNRARDRINRFTEVLSVYNKFFPNIPSRKRSRLDVLSTERSSTLLSSDRLVLGPGMGKMTAQGHTVTGGFEQEQQKSEERTKSSVPNKRTRTSLVDLKTDVRSSALARPSGVVDKDSDIVRLGNSGAVLGEDRIPSIGDGLEKTKMKKKRSGIKPDVSPNPVPTKAVDGYRDTKQGIQQRLAADARSRLSDPHGFRPGVSNGAGKADSSPQQSSVGIRASIQRADQDNGSSLNDRRDRPACSDKDRVNLRVVNKTSLREDFGSPSPTSSTKPNTSVRGPRSGSGVVTKLSPVISRPTVSNEWELALCSNKLSAVGVNNRKRTSSTRSSSPPVANWAGQRPQKISRTARRSNFVPLAPTTDDVPSLDSMSDVAGGENGMKFPRRLHSDSPQQVKKVDHFSSAALSESEESMTAEVKSRDKSKKSDERDEKSGQIVQKVLAPVISARKNKMISGEDLGDGVRRQGRTGRGVTSARSLMPMTEKHGNLGTAKQLRSTRVGFDKSESKVGRPPTRKLSDRKAYRHKNATLHATADFLDDGNEELLTAARAVLNPSHALSSTFWRELEICFCSISASDLGYLKQQENLASLVQQPNTFPPEGDGCINDSEGYKRKGDVGCTIKTKNVESFLEQFSLENVDHSEITLCQRLIAALIPEEEIEDFSCNGDEDLLYGSTYELDEGYRSNSLNQQLLGNFQTDGRLTSSRAFLDKPEVEMVETGRGMLTETTSHFGHSRNGILVDQALLPSLASSEFEYENMPLDKKILLEIQSVGIFPEALPDMAPSEDEEILEDIHKLEDTYKRQVLQKMGLVDNLLKSAVERKELQEKEFEQHALNKLVGMAYEKYMSCCGTKSSSSKIAKQAALAFVRRTLERCQKFEDTGSSCFSEPAFREKFLSASSRLNDSESADTVTEGESGRPYAGSSNYAVDAHAPGSVGAQKSPLSSRPSQNADNLDVYNSDMFRSVSLLNDQVTGKEDMWSNRVKKKELLLDDVGGASSTPSGLGNSLSSNTKGKRSERDRDGKGHSREVLSRNGTTKMGRPSLSNSRGERKTKTKSKHKTTQLSSVNGPLGKLSDPPQPVSSSAPKSSEMRTSSNSKETDEFGLEDAIDLSGLQLPGIDVLGGPDDIGSQAQDIGSWLNIDDDGLQDHDFMGLEIPMDDLTDLNMMV